MAKYVEMKYTLILKCLEFHISSDLNGLGKSNGIWNEPQAQINGDNSEVGKTEYF